jgi:LytS/YehU family sensor histidine kinase
MKRKNSRGRVKIRQKKALEQVKARIKRNGGAAHADEKEKKGITSNKEAQRLEQAKYEKALLEKRI